MKFRLSIFYVLALCAVLSCATPTYAADNDISGDYRCQGENLDGSPYTGTVKISKNGSSYMLRWQIGSQTHSGIAIRTGEILSSSWSVPSPQGSVMGVVVYQINGDRLQGTWTQYPGSGQLLKEVLVKE